jgi:hypothetical protein
MELKLDKRVIDEAVQEAVREIKKNFIPKDVLDKIRAEIEFEVDHRTNMLCVEDVFEVIDKYKTERREISMDKDPIDKYHAIKLIIDTAEEEIRGKFEECMQNNWMYDYTQFANNTRMQAYNEIEKMTKE